MTISDQKGEWLYTLTLLSMPLYENFSYIGNNENYNKISSETFWLINDDTTNHDLFLIFT